MTKRKRNPSKGYLAVILLLSLLLIALVVTAIRLEATPAPATIPPTAEHTPPTTAPTTTKIATASIANTGDMLMHKPVFQSALRGDTYDFSETFAYFDDYVSAADFSVANLETTLAGNSYPYSGYPQFNCPDNIVLGLKNTGFDLLLTANNHSYDTGSTGFYRTQQVIAQQGLAHLGTVSDGDAPLWQIQNINGISIGMLCYTYETDNNPEVTALNGIPLSRDCAACIGTFSYSELDRFYGEMAENMEQLAAAGAEAVVLYIHWGEEYQLQENQQQRTIAQKMCDLGVDVIVGGHSHVVQPMALLTSSTQPEQKTVCLYSMGNALSNQSRHTLQTAPNKEYTEDGLLFSFTFAKYSDGTVILESVHILPTWVYRCQANTPSGFRYQILPLDEEAPLPEEIHSLAQASHARTMSVVGPGLEQVQHYLAQLVNQTEAKLGVK